MSAHDDRRQHLIELAEQAESVVHTIENGWPDDATRERAGRILGYSRTVVEGADAEMISTNMASQLGNVYSQFVNNAEPTVVQNAEAWTDAVLDLTSTLPAAKAHDLADGVKESVANVKRAATMHVRDLDSEHAGLIEKLTTLDAEITATREELATTAEQARQQVENEIARARAPFETEIEQARAQLASEQNALSNLRTNQTTEFETAEERRSGAAKEQREQAMTEAEEQRQSARTTLDAFIATSETTVQERVADIERMQEDVRKMVDAVSLAATTTGYGKEATDQKKSANVWRIITVGSALVAAVLAFLAVNTDEVDLEVLIGKLVLSLILGGIAAYAAKQSGYHRNREQIARDLQLELAIFGPFIERLGPEQQEEERVQMARKTFGHVRPVSQTTSETPTTQGDPAAVDGVGQSPGALSIVAQQVISAMRGGGSQQP